MGSGLFFACFVLQYQNIFKALLRTLVATGKACFKNKLNRLNSTGFVHQQV